MKLHQLLCESVITLAEVSSLKDLKDPSTKKYYTGDVNVTDAVDLSSEQLTRLPVKFGKVGSYFNCSYNELTSLEGAPSSVDDDFNCYGNQLTSLEGASSSVGGNFYCDNNKLTSLEGVHKIIKKIRGELNLTNNPIKSGCIGLILIEGLTEIKADQPAFKIINKYLGQGKKGLLLCQDELIEAGYEEFAKL